MLDKLSTPEIIKVVTEIINVLDLILGILQLVVYQILETITVSTSVFD